MAFRFTFRRPQAQPTLVSVEPLARAPSVLARVGSVFRLVWWSGLLLFSLFDRVFSWFALPFGVGIRNPRRRYALLLGLFALIFFLGSLPLRTVPLVALGVGYLGVLAIGRAWVLNEKERTAIVKKLTDADPDRLPDLRGTALVAALLLLVLFPLLFQQLQRHYHLYIVHDEAPFWEWVWFTADKTYLKALPDWTALYGIHISAIEFDAPWGRHLVLLARLTVDYILIQGIWRLLAIRATVREAVAAVKSDPELAVRLGRRAIGPLVAKLHDPDRATRGAAANALTQLGAGSELRAWMADGPA